MGTRVLKGASQQLMVFDNSAPPAERPNTFDSGYSNEPRNSSRAPSLRSMLGQTSRESPTPTPQDEPDNNLARFWQTAIAEHKFRRTSPTEEQCDPDSIVAENPLGGDSLSVDAAAAKSLHNHGQCLPVWTMRMCRRADSYSPCA